MTRLFFGCRIPQEWHERAEETAAALRAAGIDLRWVPPENRHITIRFIGGVPDDLVARIEAAGREAAAGAAPARLELLGPGAFPSLRRARVLWLGIDDVAGGLSAVAGDLEARLRGLGLPGEEREYKPHLTLARLRDPRSLADEVRALETREPLPGEAGELTLFSSRPSPKGVAYEPLWTAALGRP